MAKDKRKVKVCKYCGMEYTVGRGKGRQGHCGKQRCVAKEYERKREVERVYRRRARAMEKGLLVDANLKTCRCGVKHNNRGEWCPKCLSRKSSTYILEGDYIYG